MTSTLERLNFFTFLFIKSIASSFLSIAITFKSSNVLAASMDTLPVPAPTSIKVFAFFKSNLFNEMDLTSSFVIGTLPLINSSFLI